MRHKFRKFNSGLWLSPSEDEMPEGALRRNRGTHPIKTSSIRSRNGMSALHSINPHSITRFNDNYFYGATTSLYRGTGSVKAGLNGDRLGFTTMPPSAGMNDYLFVTGGGSLFKVSPTWGVTNWGITAPDTSATTASHATAKTTVIDDMEDIGGAYDLCTDRWDESDVLDGSGVGLPDDGALGSGCVRANGYRLPATLNMLVQFNVDNSSAVGIASDLYTINGNTPVDLTVFSDASDSTESDYISFWLLLQYSYRWKYLQLDFSIYNSTFKGVVYSRRLVPTGEYGGTATLPITSIGAATVASATADLAWYDTIYSERESVERLTKGRIYKGAGKGSQPTFGPIVKKTKKEVKVSEAFSAVEIKNQMCTWQQVKIAKRAFERTGSGYRSHAEWASVHAVRLLGYYDVAGDLDEGMSAPFQEIFGFDDLQLEGGVGMQGTYQYAVTYRNSTTGNRSNPGDDIPIVEDVSRNPVSLANIPTSSDSQVDQREIWRTIGGGSAFWRIDIIDNNVDTTYTDTVADPDQDVDVDTPVVEPVELPTDNAVPYASFDDCVYHLGAAFWIDRTTATYRGYVYYSPTGRPEAMKGYIIVSSAEDPLQKLFKWNDALYVISEGAIYRIDGSYPYVARKVYGCPGTKKPHTVAASSYGILYESDQGVRLFNGMTAQLVAPEAVATLFRGEDAENLTAFTGTVATAGRDEYFISDTSQTLALYLPDKTWRDIGVGFNALYYSPDEQQLVGSHAVDAVTYEVEKEGVFTDGGSSFSVDIKTRSLLLDEEKDVLIERVHLDGDLSSESLTVYVTVDGTATSLGTWTNTARAVETIPIGLYGKVVSVRLTGDIISQIEIYGIEIDTNKPGEAR